MKFKKIFQKAAAVVMAAVTVFSVLPHTLMTGTEMQ